MKHIIIGMLKEYKRKELFASFLILILFGASMWLLVSEIKYNANVSNQTQGYTRYIACMIDIRNEKGAVTLPNEVSDACWAQAEKETGVSLVRYSEKILLNE